MVQCLDLIELGLRIIKTMLLLTCGEIARWTFAYCGRRFCVESCLKPYMLTITPMDH